MIGFENIWLGVRLCELDVTGIADVVQVTRFGHTPRDVSATKRGRDIESRDARTGHLRLIEVKDHADGGDVVMLTKNELLAALNSPDTFVLAVVRVGTGFAMEPVYVRRFFDRTLSFAETAVAFDVGELLAAGEAPS